MEYFFFALSSLLPEIFFFIFNYIIYIIFFRDLNSIFSFFNYFYPKESFALSFWTWKTFVHFFFFFGIPDPPDFFIFFSSRIFLQKKICFFFFIFKSIFQTPSAWWFHFYLSSLLSGSHKATLRKINLFTFNHKIALRFLKQRKLLRKVGVSFPWRLTPDTRQNGHPSFSTLSATSHSNSIRMI